MAWPLVGRDAELAAMRASLDARGVVLVGRAGVGKSRLAADAARQVGGIGDAPVLRAAGRPSARAVPLAPFAPYLSSGSAALSPLDAPEVLTEGLARRWTGTGSPILVVDDAHWLDPVSATVLLQLATHHDVRVVATVRQGEECCPEVVQLWSEEILDRIDLAPLPDHDLRALLAEVLDGSIEDATVSGLVRISAGNVLYLRELVLGSIEADLLVREHGVWRLTDPLTTTPRLADIVGGRLAGLDQSARDVLELVAVAGAVDLAVTEVLDLAGAIESLERAGLLAVVAVGSSTVVELAHPLHAEVLRTQSPATTRSRIARSLAGATAASTDWDRMRPDQRMQVALWHLEGGLDLDPRRLFDAAGEAVEAGDQVLAARLATAAFDADGSTDAVILASWCRAELGERDEAERLLLRARRAPTAVERAAVAIRLAEDRYWGRDDSPGANAIVDELLEDLGEEDAEAADLARAHRAIFTLLDGRLREARSQAQPYVDVESATISMQAELPWNLSAIFLGRCTEAGERSARALERALCDSFPYLVNPGPHLMCVGWSMLNDGDLAGARGIAELIYAEAARRPGFTDRGWASSVLGIVCLEAGRLTDAVRYFVEGEAMWRRAGVASFARIVGGLRSLAAAQLGDLEQVRAGIDGFAPCRTMAFMEVYVARARSWSDWVEGRRDQAIEAMGAAVELGADQGAIVLAAGAAHDLARFGEACAAAEAFASLGPFDEAGMPRLLQANARALAGSDLDALTQAAVALADRGYLLYAAESMMEASRWAKRRGRPKESDRLGAIAAGHLVGLGGPRTPLLAEVRRIGPLSRREREVAVLAAAGSSNRQIADELVLSERTVENHLYRVFTKLGIASRDELAAVL